MSEGHEMTTARRHRTWLRLERALLGAVMSVTAFIIERVLVRSARRAKDHGPGAPVSGEEA